jgi:hypothetical protein
MLCTLSDIPRFEAFDFDCAEKKLIPMRVGERIAGSVRISTSKHLHELHLGSGKPLKFRVKRFEERNSPCLQCPACRTWRKRLFLCEIISIHGSDLEYKLQCWECAKDY